MSPAKSSYSSPSSPCFFAIRRAFLKSGGESRRMANVNRYAVSTGVLLAGVICPPRAKINDIAPFEYFQGYADFALTGYAAIRRQ
jgi:hypothetical protein